MKEKIVIALWAVYLIICAFLTPINIDSMYIFTFAHNIKEGLIPYLDFNMIVTPLSAFLIAPFLFIWDSIVVVNLFIIPVCAIIYYFMYKIMNLFGVSKFENIAINAISSLLICFISTLGYNLLNVCCFVIILYFILKSYKTISYKLLLFLGLMSGSSILFKQTSGTILTICTLFVIFMLLFIYNRKTVIKGCLTYCASVLLTLTPFILYLFITNSFYDFVDLNIMGIFSFTSDNKLFGIMMIVAVITLICVFTIYLYYKLKDIRIIILLLFSIAQCNVMYPLPNYSHIFSASIGLLLITELFLYFLFAKYKRIGLTIISSALYIGLILINLSAFTKKDYIFSNQKYFNKGIIEKTVEEDIVLLNNYMKNNEQNTYYIITESSQMFHMNMDLYYKYYDLFFMGNIGVRNELDFIKDIENDYIIVYTDENEDFFQINPEALKYIRTLNKIEEVGKYSIYSADN